MTGIIEKILSITFIVAILMIGAIIFGLEVRKDADKKEELKNLQKENLILDNELKKLKLKELKEGSK